MKITRQSLYPITFLLTMIFVVTYFLLWYLQSPRNLFALSIGIEVYWAILLPILSTLPYSFSYFLCLPSPIFGTWILIMILMEKYVFPADYFAVYFRLLAFFLSLSIVLLFHILTRARTMFWKFPLATLSRLSIAAVSVVFLVFGIILVSPSTFRLDMPSEFFYFFVILFGYIASSMLYVNSCYRSYVLSNRLGVLNLTNQLTRIWNTIEKRYPDKQKDLDLLQYYFSESLRCFLEGDIEKSYDWGYKAIREKTLADPLAFVDDKRENKPSLGEIRNKLMHSRRGGHTETTEIRRIRKNLFTDCLDLLEREFVFIKKVSETFP
jgi:hypothetical protein